MGGVVVLRGRLVAIGWQLEILERGLGEWERWRLENLTAKIDLSNAKLKDVDLGGMGLSGADLSGADLSGADLSGADLRHAQLVSANLTKTNLSNANLSTIVAINTNFSGATLTGACIWNWHINENTNFDNVTCEYIYLANSMYLKGYSERRPLDRNFRPGEFAQIFKTVNETLDRYLREGITPD